MPQMPKFSGTSSSSENKWPLMLLSVAWLVISAMKKRNTKKKGRGAKKTGTRRSRPKTRAVKEMPKPLAERVEAENPGPEDVSITYPSAKDPVVRVRGKVVGSWADL